MNGEKPLIKKTKKSSLQSTLTLLHDDLLLSCFARVSRLYYPTLSLVSKSFRSLLASPELYRIRSLLGRTENCLYVCLRFPTDTKPRLFTLCRRPNQTQTWELVSSPGVDICGSRIYKSAGIEEKVYMSSKTKLLAYEPKEGRWDMVERKMENCWFSSYCVIENVLYSYHLGDFKWYDSKVRYWKKLKSSVDLRPMFALSSNVKLAGYDGKMVALWDEFLAGSANEYTMTWCAEIALERHNNNEEIWGNVDWYSELLTVPESYEFKHALAATV